MTVFNYFKTAGKKILRAVTDVIFSLKQSIHERFVFSSLKYWEKRYQGGGYSGQGSVGKLAQFKANVINEFNEKIDVSTYIEIGCGDGSQIERYEIGEYVGLEVSQAALDSCIEKHGEDPGKSFFLYHPKYFVDHHRVFQCDVSMSLDIIYHLVEDELFERHMTHLFQCASQYVIIYSSNMKHQEYEESESCASHVKHRKFTEWIDEHAKEWELYEKVENEFPLSKYPEKGTWSDFYIYERMSE